LKKRSLVISALAALVTAGVLAGCGNNYYFAGRVLPPSGIANRVLIAIQNPARQQGSHSNLSTRITTSVKATTTRFPSSASAATVARCPATIQNMPEEQLAPFTAPVTAASR
jgi:hypothetical protein